MTKPLYEATGQISLCWPYLTPELWRFNVITAPPHLCPTHCMVRTQIRGPCEHIVKASYVPRVLGPRSNQARIYAIGHA